MNDGLMLSVDARFCGPPGAANGGYPQRPDRHGARSGGDRAPEPARLPLETPLALLPVSEDRWQLTDRSQVLAAVRAAELTLEVPTPPPYIEALDAGLHYAGFTQHPYPRCFVCGPDRTRPDGLRLFAGARLGRCNHCGSVAAGRLARGRRRQGRAGVHERCARLSGFLRAGRCARGRVAARRVHRARRPLCVHVDEPCVVIGWPLVSHGRKHTVGTAVFRRGRRVLRLRARIVDRAAHLTRSTPLRRDQQPRRSPRRSSRSTPDRAGPRARTGRRPGSAPRRSGARPAPLTSRGRSGRRASRATPAPRGAATSGASRPAAVRAPSTRSGICEASRFRDRDRAAPLGHPLAQDRTRGLPDVELGIQLPPEPLDVEQRLLQQDQLRLDARVEPAQHLEQAQQHDPEADVLQRLLEDRLADRSDRGLHLVDAAIGRQPSPIRRAASRHGGSRGRTPQGSSRRDSSGRSGLACRRCRSRPPRSAGRSGPRPARRCCRGCMSAWKKLCRNTCVKKISTPFSASLRKSVPRWRSPGGGHQIGTP